MEVPLTFSGQMPIRLYNNMTSIARFDNQRTEHIFCTEHLYLPMFPVKPMTSATDPLKYMWITSTPASGSQSQGQGLRLYCES